MVCTPNKKMLARFIEGGIVAEVCEVIHAQGGGGGGALTNKKQFFKSKKCEN
jgi:hypothetical protein